MCIQNNDPLDLDNNVQKFNVNNLKETLKPAIVDLARIAVKKEKLTYPKGPQPCHSRKCDYSSEYGLNYDPVKFKNKFDLISKNWLP